MKKKSDSSDVITKDYLDESLDAFKGEFTEFRDEMKGEFGEFRDEMKGEFGEFRDEMKGELADLRGDFEVFGKNIREEMSETITAANSKIYTRIDPLLSELEDGRLNRELTTEQIRNLDKRVTKLENTNYKS